MERKAHGMMGFFPFISFFCPISQSKLQQHELSGDLFNGLFSTSPFTCSPPQKKWKSMFRSDSGWQIRQGKAANETTAGSVEAYLVFFFKENFPKVQNKKCKKEID